MAGSETSLSFEQLYAEHADSVYRYCFRLCHANAHDAEDLAQDALVGAFQTLPTFEGRSKVRTWLFAIAYRCWIRRKHDRNTVALEAVPDLPAPTDEHPERGVERIWLAEALSQLPEARRQAIVLVKMEGLTHREAAQVLGVAEGTVLRQVFDGLRQLRRILAANSRVPPIAGIILWLFLDSRLRAWADVPAPVTLRPRVGQALGKTLQTPAAVPPGAYPASPASPVLRGALGVAGLLLLGALFWLLRDRLPGGSSSPPAVPLEPVLAALRGVTTAHARGAQTSYLPLRRGGFSQRNEQLEFWYKAPGRYRRSLRSAQTPNGEVIVGQGRATRIWYLPAGRAVALPCTASDAETVLAPFSAFSDDGLLPRLLHEGRVTSSVLHGESSNRTTNILTLDSRDQKDYYRWTLFVDPVTHLIDRCEYAHDRRVDRNWCPEASGYLDIYEYNVGLRDSLFAIPDMK